MSIEKKTTRLERIYFAITRWATLIAVTLAFIAVMGGAIYSAYLYQVSNDTNIREETYVKKLPEVSYDEIMKEEEIIRTKIAQIKSYVLKVIDKGSLGHGYSMGNMPPRLATGVDANQIATYVSNRLIGNKPSGFASCVSCHGNNGRGMSGMAPDLKELPIYNGKRAKTTTAKAVIAKIELESEEVKASKSPMEKMLDKITANINRYALRVGQDGIGRDNMETYLRSVAAYIDNRTDFITKLEPATTKLLAYGIEFSKMKNAGAAVDWKKFISTFSSKYAKHEADELKKERKVERENQIRLDEKRSSAIEAQVRLLIVINAVGIALGVFLSLTLILILIRIEKNTRRKKEDKNE